MSAAGTLFLKDGARERRRRSRRERRLDALGTAQRKGIVHTCHQLSIRQSDTGPFAYDTSPGVIAFCEVCPIHAIVEWLIIHKDKNPLSPHNRLPRCLQM